MKKVFDVWEGDKWLGWGVAPNAIVAIRNMVHNRTGSLPESLLEFRAQERTDICPHCERSPEILGQCECGRLFVEEK